MASFPLYDTFFYYFTQKSSLFVQLFRKKWEKNWASTKKLFDTPLKRVFAVNDPNDTLHVNANQGVRLLVRLIKQAIFRAKTYNKTEDGRNYANVTRGGPVAPI